MQSYKGYGIIEEENKITVLGVSDFNPVHIFDCGQCFRWLKQPDGSYTGVVRNKAVNINFENEKLHISNATFEDFKNLWYDYLDLGQDYAELKKLLEKDDIMREAIRFGYGIRLLRQDIWETLISFIISANNRIPMIMKTVGAIAKSYGSELKLDGEAYYSFPEPEMLSSCSIEQLEICRGGFRCKYIYQASQMILNKEIDLYSLNQLDTDSARKELMRIPGVGPKVADCVLLFSGTKYDVFPTDVWVKRVMEELYFKREASFREINEFAKNYFGEHTGLAQQYLFYYARENRIGTK